MLNTPLPRLSTDSIGGLSSPTVNWNHTRLRLQNLVFCGANACSDRKVMQLAGVPCDTTPRYESPPALPVAGKGHTGRVLLRRDGTTPPLSWSSFAPPFPHQHNLPGAVISSIDRGRAVIKRAPSLLLSSAQMSTQNRFATQQPKNSASSNMLDNSSTPSKDRSVPQPKTHPNCAVQHMSKGHLSCL